MLLGNSRYFEFFCRMKKNLRIRDIFSRTRPHGKFSNANGPMTDGPGVKLQRQEITIHKFNSKYFQFDYDLDEI